jgi:uncharacterized protein
MSSTERMGYHMWEMTSQGKVQTKSWEKHSRKDSLTMDLRTRFTAELKTAMLAKDAATVGTLRMVTAKLKDMDIAARPGPPLEDPAIIAMLRGMAKSRRESVEMYRTGGREELAAKEEAEITVIESFLPTQMDDAALAAAVAAAVAETGAATIKDMGKVMAVLKTKYAASLDMAKAGPTVKAALGG